MEDTSTPPSIGRLYSPGQIGLAALIGAPAAAGWFLSRNERQLGHPRNSRWWLWGGIIGTVVLVAVSFFLPPSFPRTALAAGYVAAFYSTARRLYGDAVKLHREAGGPVGSWWKIVGVSFVFLLLSCVLIFMIAFLLPESVTARFTPADIPADQP